MKEKRIISLLLVQFQSFTADCVVKAKDWVCLLFFPYKWCQDFQGARRSRDDATFPSSHGALTVHSFYAVCGIKSSQFSSGMFFLRTPQSRILSCSCTSLCKSNTMC